MKLNVLASNLNRIEAYLDHQEAQLVEAADKKRVQEMLKKAKEKLKHLQDMFRKHQAIKKEGKGNKNFERSANLIDRIRDQKILIGEYEEKLKTAK